MVSSRRNLKMGSQTKSIGGGPAVPLANSFTNWLMQGLNTGSFGPGFGAGTDAIGSTRGISGVLNDILSGGAGKVGGAMQQMIQRQEGMDTDALRSRFGAQGGTAFGTGAQFAEAQLRSQTAPQLTTAIGQLQLSALAPILQSIYGLSQKGISQRQDYVEPSGLSQAIGAIAPIAGAVAPFLMPATKSVAGAGMSPQMSPGSTMGGATNPYAPSAYPNIGSITIG